MRVCDRHRDRQARETIHVVGDDTWIDVCAECKTELLLLLSSDPKEHGAEAPTPSTSARAEKPAPKRGLFFGGN